MCKVFVAAFILLLAQRGSFKGVTEIDTSDAFAATELKDLVKMESILIDNMEKYMEKLERKLDIMSKAAKKMEAENKLASADAEKYLGNPLNSFSLLHRLQADWKAWHDYLLKPVGEAMKKELKRKPTHRDLTVAVEGLHRIQLIYDLQVDDMVKGSLHGKQYDSANLTVLDALSIGKELHKMGYSADAMAWLETALRSEYDRELYKRIFSLDTFKIFETYKEIALKSNLFNLALKALKSETHKKASELTLKSHDNRLKAFNTKLATVFAGQMNIATAFRHYSNLCRGNYTRNSSKMHCHNIFMEKDLFTFDTLKVEVLEKNPSVMLCHDVLSDSMIKTLIGMAENHLVEPARISQQKSKTGTSDSSARAAKLHKLANNEVFLKAMRKVMRRISIAANLFGGSYEAATIVNYGVRGLQSLHVDFIDKTCNATHDDSTRQASVIFYLSDVEDGGASVFPAYNLSVTPRKGSALIWHNFHSNGTVNFETMHNSCPVVVGSKWIMYMRDVVWMREQKQAENLTN